MQTKEEYAKYKSAQINNALGVFILSFGIIICIAILFTDTFVQQMTDLVAGLVLCTIGGGMMLKSRKTIKSLNLKDTDNSEDQ